MHLDEKQEHMLKSLFFATPSHFRLVDWLLSCKLIPDAFNYLILKVAGIISIFCTGKETNSVKMCILVMSRECWLERRVLS